VLEVRTVPGAGEFAIRKMPCRVIRIEKPAPDVAILHLQLPANDPLRYHAGQYVEFILQAGARRSYSMANAPHTQGEKPAIELHLRHLPGGLFTDHVFSAMKEKDILRIEGPFGSFFLREDSTKPMVLLASGTGLAPIKAIVEHLRWKRSDRPCSSVLGLPDAPRSVPARLGGRRGGRDAIADLHPRALGGDRCRRLDRRTGLVHQAVMQDLPDLSGHQVYACGAPIMVESAERDFVARCALPKDEFYADAFTSEADKHGG
jgi:CDP-4-dehydro-6-deoxyglucose reductase